MININMIDCYRLLEGFMAEGHTAVMAEQFLGARSGAVLLGWLLGFKWNRQSERPLERPKVRETAAMLLGPHGKTIYKILEIQRLESGFMFEAIKLK